MVSCSSKKKFGRIAIAIVLGGVLGAFSTTDRAMAADEAATVAATERPIVGPPSDRLSPTDVAAGPLPVTRLSPPVPPELLRGACQTSSAGCVGKLIAPPPVAPAIDRVLPSPPIVLP